MTSAAADEPRFGLIGWTEIPVLDHARAEKFYKELFDWNFTKVPTICPETGKPNPEPKAIMFNKGSTMGSLVKVEPHQHISAAKIPDNEDKKKVGVTVTVVVDGVDEMLKKIVEAGGKVYMPKIELPAKQGFLAYFLDTEENVMGVWSMK